MEKSFRRLTKPSARKAFIEAEAVTAIAHQIRVVRQQRGWTQHDLAKRLNTTQAAISRLEDPTYGRLSVKTLVELAKVFDTGLQLRFVSLVEQFARTRKIEREQLEVEPFEKEAQYAAFYSASSPNANTTIEKFVSSGADAVNVFMVSRTSSHVGNLTFVQSNSVPVERLD